MNNFDWLIYKYLSIEKQKLYKLYMQKNKNIFQELSSVSSL